MVFSGRTAALILATPTDNATELFEQPTEHAVVDLLDDCFARSIGPMRGMMFGATLPNLFAGLGSLEQRGIYNDFFFDHLQSLGPVERKLSTAFRATYPLPWAEQRYLVGTSWVRGLIAHLKCFVFNAPIQGYSVPPGDFETVSDAMAAGYPVTWLGSWNASPNADGQINFVELLPGIVVATMFCQLIEQARVFTAAKQQRYQPVPLAAPAPPAKEE